MHAVIVDDLLPIDADCAAIVAGDLERIFASLDRVELAGKLSDEVIFDPELAVFDFDPLDTAINVGRLTGDEFHQLGHVGADVVDAKSEAGLELLTKHGEGDGEDHAMRLLGGDEC